MIEQGTYTRPSEIALSEPFSSRDEEAFLGVTIIEALTRIAIRKRLIAIVTSGAMLASLVVSLILPVRYTATTKILTPQQTQSSISLMMSQMVNSAAGSLGSSAGVAGLLKNPNELYVGLLRSRPIADAIIHQFGLANLYHAKDMTAARKILAANTEVTSEKSGFIKVAVTDKDRRRSAEMASAYTDQLRILTKTLALTEASARRLFFEEQLKRAKDDLLAAEHSFRQVQEKKGLVQLDAQAKGLIASLAALRAQVAAKQVELQSLRSYSTEHNSSVQLAESQLSSLQSEVARLEQRGHAAGYGDLGLQDVAGAGLDYLAAEHEVQYRQTLLDLLVKQYDAARLDEAKYAAIIQVVEPAIPPDRRASPHRAQIVIVVTFLGFLGACLYALISATISKNVEATQALSEFKSALITTRGRVH